MKKSKIILLFKITIIIILLIYLYIFFKKEKYSIYEGNENKFIGIISEIDKKEDKIVFYIKSKEKLLVK